MVNLKLNPENSEKERLFAENFNVTGYPCILFLNQNKQELLRVCGYLQAEPFLKKMETALTASKKLVKLEKDYKAGKEGAALELLDLYIELSSQDKALALAKKLEQKAKLPEKTDYILLFAFDHFNKGEYKKAEPYMKKIMKLEKESEAFYYAVLYLSVIYYETERDEEAIKLIKENRDGKNNTIIQYFDDITQRIKNKEELF